MQINKTENIKNRKKLSERYKDFNIDDIFDNKIIVNNNVKNKKQNSNKKVLIKNKKIKLKNFIIETLYKTGKITSKNNYAVENFLTDDMFYIKLTSFLNSLLKNATKQRITNETKTINQ